jgi:MoxR-like ATPase
VREILAWVQFIVDWNAKNSGADQVYLSFVHGAYVLFLDGLGLGMSTLNRDTIKVFKVQAVKVLLDLCPQNIRNEIETGLSIELSHMSESCSSHDGLALPSISSNVLSIGPFSTPCAPQFQDPSPDASNGSYVLNAGSTLLNLFRVLRALQLPRPILLEGPPGVGKTSLISTLAKVTGHKLIRINLSEHSEISDLLGTDLPAVDSSDPSTHSSPQFKWVDGVFLSALKNGDWVLLDELNLAPQSVLEGLNACFDHRGEVFLPEIGQTFKCPPSFRVFCAQNPVAEGGGRKGLPQSFLSRFSRVFVEAMTLEDLIMIAQNSMEFNPMTRSFLDEYIPRMVRFVHKLQFATSGTDSSSSFGRSGSPWEFNLRDTLRWLEVFACFARVIESLGEDTAQILHAHQYLLRRSASLLFAARMRTDDDKSAIGKLFVDALGMSLSSDQDAPVISISSHKVDQKYFICGWAKLSVSSLTRYSLVSHPFRSHGVSTIEYGQLYGSLKTSLENISFCVEQNWPVLLVGAPGSGKKKLVRYLAEQTGNHLLEFPMTSSIDASDLLGSFEQLNLNRSLHNTLRLAEDVVLSNCGRVIGGVNVTNNQLYQATLKKCCAALREIKRMSDVVLSMDALRLDSGQTLLRLLDLLVSDLFGLAQLEATKNEDTANMLSDLQGQVKILVEIATSINLAGFQWVDGILIDAMKRGFWLLFDNANLCSPSVLDRLNSLLEPNGTILLTESGEGQYLKPHPNFRVFFSMDPSGGEVSRAMRNRCVECFVEAPHDYDLLLKFAYNSTSHSPVCRAALVDTVDKAFSCNDKRIKTHITLAYCKMYAIFLNILESNYRYSRTEPEVALVLLDMLAPYSGLDNSVSLLRHIDDKHLSPVPARRICFSRLTHIALDKRALGQLELLGIVSTLSNSQRSANWNLLHDTILHNAKKLAQRKNTDLSKYVIQFGALVASQLPAADADESTLSSCVTVLLALILRSSIMCSRIQLLLIIEYLTQISKNGSRCVDLFSWVTSILSSLASPHKSSENHSIAPYVFLPQGLKMPCILQSKCYGRDSLAVLFPICAFNIENCIARTGPPLFSLANLPFFDELDYAVYRLTDTADESSQMTHVNSTFAVNDALTSWSTFQIGYAMSIGILSASESKELQVVFAAFTVCNEIESMISHLWRKIVAMDSEYLRPDLFRAIRGLMDSRDYLSYILRTSPRTLLRNKLLLPFDALSICLVWVSKSLEFFTRELSNRNSEFSEVVNLSLLNSKSVQKALEYIEVCFGRSGGQVRKNRLWKIGGHVEVPILAKDWNCLYTIRECMALLGPPQDADSSIAHMTSYLKFRRSESQLVEDCVGFSSTFYLLKTRERSWIGSERNFTLSSARLDADAVADEILRRCKSSRAVNIVDPDPVDETNELVVMERFAKNVKKLIESQEFECGFGLSVNLAEVFVVRQMVMICEAISSLAIELNAYLNSAGCGESALEQVKLGVARINQLSASTFFVAVHFSCLDPSLFRELRTLSWCAAALQEEFTSSSISQSKWTEFLSLLRTAVVSIETRCSSILNHKSAFGNLLSWSNRDLEDVLGINVLKSPSSNQASDSMRGRSRISALFLPKQLYFSLSHVDARALASKAKATRVMYSSPGESDIPTGMSPVVKKRLLESFRLLIATHSSSVAYKSKNYIECMSKLKLYSIDALLCFLDYFKNSRNEIDSVAHSVLDIMKFDLKIDRINFQSSLEALNEKILNCNSDAFLVSSEIEISKLRSLLWSEFLYPVLQYFGAFLYSGDAFDMVEIGLMWVRLGCLRAQLCLPSLPIDPSTKYATKASILSRHYDRLCSILTLSYSANTLGSISDVGAELKNLTNLCASLKKRINTLNARSIERPFNHGAENGRVLEAFVDVFEKLQIGTENLANPFNVLLSIKKIQTVVGFIKNQHSLSAKAVEEIHLLFAEAENRRESLNSFQANIYETLPEYEDVYSPLFSSLQNMSYGLGCVVTYIRQAFNNIAPISRTVSLTPNDAVSLIRYVTEYPFMKPTQSDLDRSVLPSLNNLLYYNTSLTKLSAVHTPCPAEPSAARKKFLSIFRLVLQRVEYFVDSDLISFQGASRLLRAAIELLLDNHRRSEEDRIKGEAEKASLYRTKDTSYVSDDAKEEEASLRKHFPDHLKELGIVSKGFISDENGAMDVSPNEREDSLKTSAAAHDSVLYLALDFGSLAVEVIGQELRMFMQYAPIDRHTAHFALVRHQDSRISAPIRRQELMRGLIDRTLLVAKEYAVNISEAIGESLDSDLLGLSCLALSVMASECDTSAGLARYDLSKFGGVDRDLMYLLYSGTNRYEKPLNFHTDRFGSELLTCAEPLKRLISRCSELLVQFPGNEILVHVCTLAVKLSNYHISTPLGKMLASLELLYRNAYEWESYAAKHVSMAEEISRLGSVIGKWRTLELQSWDHLLRVKEEEYIHKAANSWFPLTSSLLEFWPLEPSDVDMQPCAPTDCFYSYESLIPSWMMNHRLQAKTPDLDSTLINLFDTLDLFLKSCTVGEFPTRLHLVRLCALRLSRSTASNEPSLAKKSAFFVVFNLWKFYDQFLPSIRKFQEILKSPIQKRISDEIKISKWDQLSSYGLIEHSERIHRKLNKIIRQYQSDVLDYPVSSILRRETLGDMVDKAGEAVAAYQVPDLRQFFPYVDSAERDCLKVDLVDEDEEEEGAAIEKIKAGKIVSVPLPKKDKTNKKLKSEETMVVIERRASSFDYVLDQISNIWSVVPVSQELSDMIASSGAARLLKVDDLNRKLMKYLQTLLTIGGPCRWGLEVYELVEDVCNSIFFRIQALRPADVPRNAKYKALKDMFDGLENEVGISHLLSDSPDELRSPCFACTLPSPLFRETLIDSSWNFASPRDLSERGENYYFKCVSELNELRTQASCAASPDVGAREVAIMLALTENMFYKISHYRAKLCGHIDDLQRLGLQLSKYIAVLTTCEEKQQQNSASTISIRVIDSVESYWEQKQSMVNSVINATSELEVLVQAAVESLESTETNDRLNQFAAIVGSSSLTDVKKALSELRGLKADLDSCATPLIADVEGSAIMFDSAICSQMSLEVMSSFKSKPRSLAKIRAIEEAEIVVSSAYVKMKSIVETLSSAVPDTVSSRVLEIFASSVKGLSRCAEELRNPAVSVKDDKTEGNLLNDLGEIFEYDLIRIQNLKECAETFSNMDSKSAKSISEKLEQAHNSMVALALKDTTMKLSKFYSSLVNSSSATSCRNVISALRAVIPSTISLFMGSISIVDDLIKSQKSMCKLTYVCIRVFRTIIAKGFCGSKVKEEAGDGNGDAENMTFEDDVEGTGMGEGDGKKDVSDQIQNEEQLLGLKSDESKPPSEEAQQPEKKLNKEEKDKGVEMTQDFDGDMFDVPSSDESSHNSDQENEDDEDELDREMDNDGEINQKNVVDEKMWGSDDELDESKEEKFEDNSKSKGETLDGEMTTKQNGEEEDDISSHNDNDRDDDSKAPNGGKEDEAEEHGKDINEDTAERHVEKPLGVDVRESENENSGQEDEKDQDEEGSQGVDKMEELDSQEEESDGMPPFESDPNAQAMEDSELPENLPEDMELDDAASLEGSQDDGDDGAEAENDLPNEGDIDAESHEYQIDGSVGDEPDQDNLVKGGDQDHAVELDAHSRKHQKSANASAFGVQSKGGQDSIQAAEKGHDGDERNRRQQDALGSEGDGEGAGGSSSDQSSAQNAHEKQELSSAGIDDSNGGSNSGNDKGSADGTKSRENSMSARSREAPNPFRKKGDLSKAWFERLDLKRSNKSSSSQRNQESQSQGGTFEFELNSGHDAQDDNAVGDQVLAETVDGDAAQLPEQGHEDQNANSGSSVEKSSREADAEPQDSSTDHNTGDGIDSSAISSLKRNREDITAEDASGNAEGEDGVHEGRGSDERSKKKSKVGEDEANYGDSVVAMDDSSENVGPDTAPAMDIEDAPQDSLSAELENLNGNKFGGKSFSGKFGEILNAAKKNGIVEAKLDDEVDELSFKSIDALQSSLLQSDGAELWARHKALAEESSASLCEQLRLILEPNLTARLRGDYRTGKRINMRKVISYVASGFRRDKIWLRRTKLAKRSYQVMLMIDDTYSMGAAGSLALTSLAIISGALTRLEVGELCVASFSDRVNILHPFGATFSDESGSKIASSITFKASKTLLADALQSVIPVFEEARHTFGGRTSGDSKTTVQLCFLLSDARLDTDNRSRLQSVVRDMAEKHIMVVLIIIDHNVNSRDSIFNTKSIEFTDDGIVTRPYLQDFPFPFYVAIQKLSALPVVLSDSLRQWFEFVQHSIDDA